MPPRTNPLRLNPLQRKTLAVLQALAQDEGLSERDEHSGDVRIVRFPHAHGQHFHIGEVVVMAKDASGLNNESVWKALKRKGLIRGDYPLSIRITPTGQEYDSGLADKVLRRADH